MLLWRRNIYLIYDNVIETLKANNSVNIVKEYGLKLKSTEVEK